MVFTKDHKGFSFVLIGQCGMEIVFLLLLTVSLTAASPLKPTQRSESTLPVDTVEASAVKGSAGTQEQHAPSLKIIPLTSQVQHLERGSVKHRLAAMLRQRRAIKRGCKLGTCQLHILANTLYQIGNTNGKDESKKANDPQGYGR